MRDIVAQLKRCLINLTRKGMLKTMNNSIPVVLIVGL